MQVASLARYSMSGYSFVKLCVCGASFTETAAMVLTVPQEISKYAVPPESAVTTPFSSTVATVGVFALKVSVPSLPVIIRSGIRSSVAPISISFMPL